MVFIAGHASLIGEKSGKVISVGVRCKKCKQCDVAKASGKPPRVHNCPKNHVGSPKSMESAMVIDMLRKVKSKGKEVIKLVTDDDATTIARARKEVSSDIKHVRDNNHVKKNIGKALYKLQKKHKKFSTKVIDSIKKNVKYALAQNKGDPAAVREGLKASVAHPHGDHTHCGDWCGYQRNPQTFKHRNLPYGKDLTDQSLKADLEATMEPYVQQSESLANLGSTQANESFNNLVSQKAPKRLHFSGSSSLKFRVDASVTQKNEGKEVYLRTACSSIACTEDSTEAHVQITN